MMENFIDCGYATMNHFGEELCGDRVQIVESGGCKLLVLADGMGSGVKANILSTMTAKIFSTMLAEGAEFADCVRTVMEALPVCRERGMNYCTFTVIRMEPDGRGVLYEYDNPQVIWMREGKCWNLERRSIEVSEKTVYKSIFQLQSGDTLVAMSDGVIFAGPDTVMNYDWQRPQVMDYLSRMAKPEMSAQSISALLAGACNDLYCGRPSDDTTVAAVKLRAPYRVAVMVGPPLSRRQEKRHFAHFMETGDCHIVCGGTTSEIVAQYLNKPLTVLPQSGGGGIPPCARLEGIDLVTEGALTIARVAELAKRHLDPYQLSGKRYLGGNGADAMARLLFEKATDVTFFIGRTVNEAHAGTEADSAKKMRDIASLCKSLRAMGKRVKEIYH